MALEDFNTGEDGRGGQNQLDIDLEELVDRYESGKTSRELADEYSCGKTTILRKLRKAEADIRDAERMGTEIDTNPSPELAYFIGVLEAEGNIYTGGDGIQYTIGVTDIEFADSIEECMNLLGFNPVRYTESKEVNKKATQDTVRLKGYSKPFYKWYNTKNTLKLLEEKEHKIEFIRGFYESEGWITQPSNNSLAVGMNNTNIHLLDIVETTLSELGFKFSRYHKQKKKENHSDVVTLKLSRTEEVVEFIETIDPVIKNKV